MTDLSGDRRIRTGATWQVRALRSSIVTGHLSVSQRPNSHHGGS
jgi:hypothetical protein